MRLLRGIAALLASLLCFGVARAQVVEVIRKNGKTLFCMRTGLVSEANDCGTKSDWYAYVFVGSISAVSSAPHDEQQIQIHAEEIFWGAPPPSLTVLTSQAWCLPKLAVGDRWLFYLRQEKSEPIVLDYYANDSLPLASADAHVRLNTLRRLRTIGGRGVLRGHVWQGEGVQGKPVAHAIVIARGPGGRQFITRSDSQGHYEFPPLPAGSYKIRVRSVGAFRADPVSWDVTPSSCWDITLTHNPRGEISGYVRHPDGSPILGAQVLLVGPGYATWETSHVDAQGRYSFGSLHPGKYIIGLRPSGAPATDSASGGTPPPMPLYYPGVDRSSAAAVIGLRDDQRRDKINFTVPAE
jgi:Carboxypeptidase regulatory-like domain